MLSNCHSAGFRYALAPLLLRYCTAQKLFAPLQHVVEDSRDRTAMGLALLVSVNKYWFFKKVFIMAKGSQFWGNASGKLGEQVLYRAGGEQRARTYVARIKNPRTEGQAVNRLSMRNFATAFRAFKDVIRLSFPNRPVKESGFNAFIKANKTASSAAISALAANSGYFVPKGLTISKGNLGAILGAFIVTPEGGRETFEFNRFNVTGMSLSEVQAIAAPLGLTVTDLDSLDPVENETPSAAQVGKFLELIGYKSDATVTCLQADYADEGFERVAPNVSFTIYFNNPYIMCTIHFTDAEDATQDTTYMAVMVSQKVDGKVDVTTSSFVPSNNNTVLADQFVQGGDVYDELLNAYVKNSEVLPSAV